MTASLQTEPSAFDDSRRRTDAGFSLLEILVTLSLMGITVVAVLAGLQTTIRGSVTDRDHATAFSWLQSASDEIYRVDREPCTSGQAATIATYDTAANSVQIPPVWSTTGATISVIDVEFLGKTGVDADFEWSSGFCFEGAGYLDSPLYTQRVTLEVIGPNAKFVRTMQMVKSQ